MSEFLASRSEYVITGLECPMIGKIDVSKAWGNLFSAIPHEGRATQLVENSTTLKSIEYAVSQMHPTLYGSLFQRAVIFTQPPPSIALDGQRIPTELLCFDRDRIGEDGEHFLFAEMLAAYLIMRDFRWLEAGGKVTQAEVADGRAKARDVGKKLTFIEVETIPFSVYQQCLVERSKAAWKDNAEHWDWLAQSWSNSQTVRGVFSLGVGSAIELASQQAAKDRYDYETLCEGHGL